MDIIRHHGRDIENTEGIPIPWHALAWQDAVERWGKTLKNLGTRRNYKVSVKSFFETPGAPHTIEAITTEQLEEWCKVLADHQQLQPGQEGRITTATVNRHLAGMKSFLRYWILQNKEVYRVHLSRDMVNETCKSVKGKSEKRYDILSESESSALVASARTPNVTEGATQARKGWQPQYTEYPLLAQRDGAIILLALGTGCRVAELANLNISDISEDVDVKIWWLHIRQGKGNNDRFVPIAPNVAHEVVKYIEATGRALGRNSDKDMPIWLTRRNGRLSIDHMRAIIDSAADRAANQNAIGRDKVISPHSLRHTYAMSVLEGNEKQDRRPGTLLEVKELLGHANVATTQRYLDHIDKRKLAVLAPQVIE